MRADFLSVEKKIAAMIYKKNDITALQLLSIVCERYAPEPQVQYEMIKDNKESPALEGCQILTEEEIKELLGTPDAKHTTMRKIMKDVSDG